MTSSESKTEQELSSIRETVESIWIAIVLAFVLRAFLIEAFVIPTGSMAPRLMGEHWDLTCPSCGYDFAFGATRDVQRGKKLAPSEVRCPNCSSDQADHGFINGGDRVLVLKYLYHFSQPQPWDVVVFKNPQNNRENYIKRLIGLPGETIEIVHGDIFVKPASDQPWQIRRKPARSQEAMWQVIFDNDYRPDPKLVANPPQWLGPADLWTPQENGRVFEYNGKAPGDLVFSGTRKSFLPTYGYNPTNTDSANIDPNLDICTDLKLSLVFFPSAGDSAVQLQLTSFERAFFAQVAADGTVSLSSGTGKGPAQEWGRAKLPPLRLNHGTQVALTHVDYRVTVWVDGKAVLESTDEQYKPDLDKLRELLIDSGLQRSPHWLQNSDVPPEQSRRWLLGMDARLIRRWLEGELSPDLRQAVRQDPEAIKVWLREQSPEQFRQIVSRVSSSQRASEGAIPIPQVRITASGGRSQLHHLRLMRDVYYTSPAVQTDSQIEAERMPDGSYAWSLGVRGPLPGWATTGHPLHLAKYPDRPDQDEFFVLGDNSPASLDGRMWTRAAPSLRLRTDEGQPLYTLGTVPRYNMIGKAFFVYWPSGFRVPGLNDLPVIPNVGRMRLIR